MRSANSEIYENGRKVADLLAEMRSELIEFVRTRITMLRTEVREKWKSAIAVVPFAGAAALLLGTAYLLIVGALVGLVLAAFPHSNFRWFFAFIIVGLSWAILGTGAAYLAKRVLGRMSLMPKRTLEVLKGDKVWIKAEIKNRV